MNATQFIAVTRKSLGIESDEPKPDKPTMDTAWIVLEAANDLGDDATVAARRRVIDANFSGALAAQSDCISLRFFQATTGRPWISQQPHLKAKHYRKGPVSAWTA
jgi:hypothetical protein